MLKHTAVSPLNKIYKSTWDWISSLNPTYSFSEELYFHIKQDPTNFCVHPVSLEKEVHWRFRAEYNRSPPEQFIAIIPWGRAVGNQGTIITPDNHVLWDVSYQYSKTMQEHSIFKKADFPPIRYTPKRTAVISFVASDNYYHWMFDILPRFDLLWQSGIDVDQYLVSRMGNLAFQSETLKHLGVSEDKLLDCTYDSHVEAKELVVVSLPGHTGHMPKWACNFLREKFLDKSNKKGKAKGYELIYISREKARFRNVINEKQVIRTLKTYGFQSIRLEDMNVGEQINMFSRAKIIISPHGAGLTNLVFCTPGTKVVEFFAPTYINPCYWVLCNHVNLDYHYIIGEGASPPEFIDPHRVHDPIEVNIEKLEKMIKFLLLKVN